MCYFILHIQGFENKAKTVTFGWVSTTFFRILRSSNELGKIPRALHWKEHGKTSPTVFFSIFEPAHDPFKNDRSKPFWPFLLIQTDCFEYGLKWVNGAYIWWRYAPTQLACMPSPQPRGAEFEPSLGQFLVINSHATWHHSVVTRCCGIRSLRILMHVFNLLAS